MPSLLHPKISLLTLLFFTFAIFIVSAIVPQNETFKFENSGELGDFIVEYRGDYRMISIFNSPFQVGFYNTTPNAFTLALRVGLTRSEQLFRWVWEANRGNPVGENATFSLGADGNLVLADFDGRIAWQTNTANKGVVAFRLLSNGNMVLIDAKDFAPPPPPTPTDTQLIPHFEVDLSEFFTTDQIFNTREEVIDWARSVGKSCGVVVVIKRSDKLVRRGTCDRVIFCCDRQGRWSNKDNVFGSKRTCCPFRLRAVSTIRDGGWKIQVRNGLHNHPLRTNMLGSLIAK